MQRGGIRVVLIWAASSVQQRRLIQAPPDWSSVTLGAPPYSRHWRQAVCRRRGAPAPRGIAGRGRWEDGPCPLDHLDLAVESHPSDMASATGASSASAVALAGRTTAGPLFLSPPVTDVRKSCVEAQPQPPRLRRPPARAPPRAPTRRASTSAATSITTSISSPTALLGWFEMAEFIHCASTDSFRPESAVWTGNSRSIGAGRCSCVNSSPESCRAAVVRRPGTRAGPRPATSRGRSHQG